MRSLVSAYASRFVLPTCAVAFQDSQARLGVIGVGRLIPKAVRAVAIHIDIGKVFWPMRIADAYRERALSVASPDFTWSIEIGFMLHLKHTSSCPGLGQVRREADCERGQTQ